MRARGGLHSGVDAVRGVWHAKDLRRLVLSWGMFFFVEWTSLVGLSVWAFGAGGTGAVGVIGLARLLPGGLAVPVGAWAADRFPRRRLVAAVFVAQAALLAALAVGANMEAPVVVMALLVAVNSVAASPFRPAQLALVPLVARSAEELVAANVAAGVVEGVATLLSPVVAALVLTRAEPAAVLVVGVLAAVAGVVAVAGVRPSMDPSRAARRRKARITASLLAGVQALRATPAMVLVVGCFVAQLVVRGLLTVLLVPVAYDLLGMQRGGLGWLGAAMGVGGVVGGAGSVVLTGRRRLAVPFALALVLWGAPIALIGLVPRTAVALGSLAVVGFGNALLDVSGFTLLQRLGDDHLLGRVFGVLFTVGIALGGLGSLAAPALTDLVGLRVSLVLVGSILPIVAVVTFRFHRTVDAGAEPPEEALRVLGGVDLLAGLPPTTLEKLAMHSETVDVPPGRVLVREGEHGDRFFTVASGAVRVTRDGSHVAELGAGDYFGEVALVRTEPRNATVVALTATRLVTVSGPAFLGAVVADATAYAQLDQLVGRRTASR